MLSGDPLHIEMEDREGNFVVTGVRVERRRRPLAGPERERMEARLRPTLQRYLRSSSEQGLGRLLKDLDLPPERLLEVRPRLRALFSARGGLEYDVLDETQYENDRVTMVVRIPALAEALEFEDDRFQFELVRSGTDPRWRPRGGLRPYRP
jgi:hypothetical protein